MKTSRTRKSSKDQPLLINVAESIGSTLGAIAAKADAAQRAITRSDLAGTAEKLLRKGKRAASHAKSSVRRAKPARAAGRTVRKAAGRVTGKRARDKK
jgi:hypothetical protein